MITIIRGPVGGGVVLDAETIAWRDTLLAAGGTLAADSVSIANAWILNVKGRSYNTKLLYDLPWLGSNIRAAIQPLRDSLAKGVPGNNGPLVNGDFSQSTGVVGNGSTKGLAINIKPSELGASNNGGIGFWDLAVDITGASYSVAGTTNAAVTNYFTLRNYSSAYSDFIWGLTANSPQASVGGNGFVYGQRENGTLRRIVFNGVSQATNTTSDATSGSGDLTILVFGLRTSAGTAQYDKSRSGYFCLTDGTLSSGEYLQLYNDVQTYLITPTGR